MKVNKHVAAISVIVFAAMSLAFAFSVGDEHTAYTVDTSHVAAFMVMFAAFWSLGFFSHES